MALTSFAFLSFLAIALAFFVLIMGVFPRAKSWFIVALNIAFYSSFGWKGLLICVVLTILGYICTYMIQHSLKLRSSSNLDLKTQLKTQLKSWAEIWLFLSLSIPIFALLFFKFFQSSLQFAITNQWILPETNLQFLLPVGLSFYSFRIISHAVDVFYKKITLPSFINYAAFVGFFPHIIAGPITRADKFYEDLESTNYQPNGNKITLLFLSGFFKKLVLSSFLYNYTTQVFQLPEQFATADLLFALAIFSAYIFTDFSGYSDLANATAMLFGFKPTENFAGPYGSKSVGEFWQRWHISLSQWFRDYLYIPMGGDGRNSKYKNIVWIRNTFVVMMISGVWHGVGFGFLLWGFFHAIGILLGNLLAKFVNKFVKTSTPIKVFLGWVATFFTFIFVSSSWIFFATNNLNSAINFFAKIATFSDIPLKLISNYILLFVVILILIQNIFYHKISSVIEFVFTNSRFVAKVLIMLFCIVIISFLKPEIVPPYVYQSF